MQVNISGLPVIRESQVPETPGSRDVLVLDSEKPFKDSKKINFWNRIKKSSNENIKLAINPHKLSTFLIKPTVSIKNDKVGVMLQGFSEHYREPINMVSEFKVDQEGITLPRQDIFSFEMVLSKDGIRQYATTKESLKDYMEQQLRFSWYRSPLAKVNHCIFEDFENNNSIGYEIKLKHCSALSLKIDGRSGDNGILRDLLEISKMLKPEEKAILQICFQPAELEWWKEGEEVLKELPKRLKKEKSGSNSKLGLPVFDTSIRLIVNSSSRERSELISRGFLMCLKHFDGDNELKSVRVKDKKYSKWLKNDVKQRKVDTSFFFKNRNLLSTKEIGPFVRLPTRTLQLEFDLKIDEREEISIPSILRSKNTLPIGISQISGKQFEVGIPDNNLDDFMKSYCYIGSPRTGKDTSMINFIVEAAKRGHGAIIPDAINEVGNDRGMADSIRDALPASKIVDLSLDDYNFPIYFGIEDLIEEIGENGINLMSDNLLRILKLDDKFESKKLARLVAKACKCNLYDMYCFVRSPKYQLVVLERLKEENELLALELEHEYIRTNVPNNIKGAILSRLDELMGNDLLKYMFAQEPHKRINFKKWISQGKVVIIRMTKTDIGELGTQVLMYLLTIRVFWLKKMMNKDNKLKDKSVFMVFNEFFQYMSPSLEETLTKMIVECPKYRLGMLFAFHSPSSDQISTNFWETLKSSSLNYFLFKNTNPKVYKDMEETLKPILLDVAAKTETFESIFIPYVGGKQHTPFFVKMLLPPSKRQGMFDNSDLTEQHKIKYGTELKFVKERIKEREIWMYRADGEDEEEE